MKRCMTSNYFLSTLLFLSLQNSVQSTEQSPQEQPITLNLNDSVQAPLYHMARPYEATQTQSIALILLLENDPTKVVDFIENNNFPANTFINVPLELAAEKRVNVRKSLFQILVLYKSDEGIKYLIERDRSLLFSYHYKDDPFSKEKNNLSILQLFVFYGNTETLGHLLEQGADPKANIETIYGPTEVWQWFALQGDLNSLIKILDFFPDINLEKKIGNFTIIELLEAKDSNVRALLTQKYKKIKSHKKELASANESLVKILKILGINTPSLMFFPSYSDIIKHTIKCCSLQNKNFENMIRETEIDLIKSIVRFYEKSETVETNSSVSIHLLSYLILINKYIIDSHKLVTQLKLNHWFQSDYLSALRVMLPTCHLLKAKPTSEQIECLTFLKILPNLNKQN